MPNLLLEIGCEEIPAGMLEVKKTTFSFWLEKLLVELNLTDDQSRFPREPFCTPRRLVATALSIRDSQPDVKDQVIGPSLKVAYKDGKPTPAAEAFAKKVGLDISNLEKVSNYK